MNKSIRRFTGIFLVLCLLCGCAPSAPQEKEEDDTLIKVGFVQVGSESNWRVANSESMKNTFTEDNGYELFFYDAKQKQENQIQAIRNYILQEMDYIVLAPVVETGWDEVLEEVKDAGIPLIIVDRSVDVEDSRLYTARIGSDMVREATYVTNWLEDYLTKQGRENDEIRFVHIQGTEGSTAQIGRSKGLQNAVDAHSNWSVVASGDGDFTKAKAYEIMNQIISQTEDFDVVYCENDNEAFGVMEALDANGITYGANGKVIIISFDATKQGLKECLKGNILVDAECNPLLGPKVEKLIQSMEQKEPFGKIAYVNETFFTYDTITKEVIDKRAY